MNLNLDQMQKLLQSLSGYFELQPFSDTLARLEIKQDIATGKEGRSVPAGEYFIDADSIIYHPTPEGQMGILPVSLTKLTPLRTASGDDLKLAHLILYIGEYMIIPREADALLGNYFSKNPLTAALQDITLPRQVIQPIDRLTQTFLQNKLPPSPKTYKVTSGTIKVKGKPMNIYPEVTVSLLDLPPGVELSRDITNLDGEVFTAVLSLFDADTKHFTGQDIYRVMTGNPRALASPEKLKAIDESWMRLTSTAMRISTGNMGTAYHFVRWVRESRVIEGRKDTVIVRNQHGIFETTVYSVNEEPTLLTYADALNQVLRYPLEVRNTPINKTLEMTQIQNYLLKRIYGIPNTSNHIRYDSIFSRVNLESLSPDAQARKKEKLRTQIRALLRYWTKIGLISGFEEQKQNKAYYCIVIDKSTGRELPAGGSEEGVTPKKTGGNP